MDDLNSENYILFAARYYSTLHYTTKEFNSDLKRVSYVKRLINRYLVSGKLKERLILNHIILLFNVFSDKEAVQKLLFFKLDVQCYSVLKTFLVYLNRMPNEIIIDNKTIILTQIPIDMELANILRNL